MPINKVGSRSRNKKSSRALYNSKGHIQSGLVNNMAHGAVFSNKINNKYNGPFSQANQRKNNILKTFNSWMVNYSNNINPSDGKAYTDNTTAKAKMNSTKKATQEVNSLSVQKLNSGTYAQLMDALTTNYGIPRKKNNFIHRNINLRNAELINYFNNFSLIEGNEFYSFNKNTPNSTVYLTQRSFVNGTVRITVPGYYKLNSDIVFHPNSNDKFRPTANQIMSGQYPMGADGAYHLGFFAAITIEADGVILDLNGFKIEQSKEHNLMQRFFSVIELANSPFIPKQGPSSFSNDGNYKAPTNVLIKNGKLGRSSHHGIHGNSMKKIYLLDLDISDFEVAGIALNGTEDSILENITIHDISEKIPVLSTFPQAIFIQSFLDKVKSDNPNASLNLKSGSKNIDTIINELKIAIEYTKNEILNDRELDDNNLFKNDSGLYDGNAYGIVLNVNGVVVHGLMTERTEEMIGNKNIHLENITINNIITEPVEIVGLSLKEDPNVRKQFMRITKANKEPAFGGKSQAGPVGDILSVEKILDVNNRYKGNVLSNAQLIIAKYLNEDNKGTNNISPEIITWAESDTSIIDVMNTSNLSFTYGGDSMGHIMKGNIALFVSAGVNINMNGLTINNIETKNNKVGSSIFIDYTDDNSKLGLSTCGCCVTGSKAITIKNENISSIISEYGIAERTKEINSSIENL